MKKLVEPTRRGFIATASVGIVGMLIGCGKGSEGDDTNTTVTGETGETGSTGTTETGTGTSTGTTTGVECAETPTDIEGPFWREGVPVRDEYDIHGDEGISLTLSGTVSDVDCTPLPGAIVEIWHAYPSTVPVEELNNSDSVDYDHNSPQMRYRGQLACDENGQYSLHTLKPGWYLNGPEFRPSHIHVKIWVDGVERLTTQLYFKDDPFIESDAWATEEMAVALEDDGTGRLSGQFDFVVDA